MFSDSASDYSSASSHDSSSQPPSPTKARRRPAALRLNSIGVDPDEVIGKTLTRVRRSAKHPTLTLDFSDNTTFQVLIDGYDPTHPGVPKELEMDSWLDPVFNPPSGQATVDLTIVDCAYITLSDKAFLRKQTESAAEWDQSHSGVAFKFQDGHWHCVWATLAEYAERQGPCVFRSYDDVYLDKLQRSPRKPHPRKKKSRTGGWENGN
ncbi:hypothetical protein PLICRDRAFT_463139 [Plicaturopsis crispa FD-325 SS-3]|nr:hypothetical protein PLICRDRAFT_463139 [Plicaturopsis crispa FD-325 SS-3]